tara:strand:+ start:2956 stop:4353 length:1398 start_codon:yes stop_codon:yes gene_type:complete
LKYYFVIAFLFVFLEQTLAHSGRVLGVQCGNEIASLSLLDGDFLSGKKLKDKYPAITDAFPSAFLMLNQIFEDGEKASKELYQTHIEFLQEFPKAKVYPGFSEIEDEDLLIERSAVCEEFVLAELIDSKLRVSPRFDKLDLLSRAMAWAELLLLNQADEYAPISLRSLVYSIFSNEFFNFSLQDRHRKIYAAGFNHIEYGVFRIDLTKDRSYREDDGSLSSAKLVQSSLVSTSYGNCYASNQSSSIILSKTLAKKLFVESCNLFFSNTLFSVRSQSFIDFGSDGRLVSFEVKPNYEFQYRNLNLKASTKDRVSKVLCSKSKNDLVYSFEGFYSELDLFGRSIRLRNFKKIFFTRNMDWPSLFYTDDRFLLSSPIGNLLVSNLILLDIGGQFRGGFVVDEHEIYIQSKKVYAQANSFLSFSKTDKLLKMKLAKTGKFQTESGRDIYLMAGQVIVFNENGYVVDYDL